MGLAGRDGREGRLTGMRAVTFTDQLALRSDYPDPRPGAGEAVVQVSLAGICRTDLEIVRGYMDFHGVPGHEFVGRVVSGPAKWKNRRVVAEINCVCGSCDMCQSGLRNHCRNRAVLGIAGRDGAFADRVAVPVRNLHAVPDGVSDEAAVFVEPLAAAFQLVRQIRFDAAQKVVVLGDGRLGQLVGRVLVRRCPSLVLVGRHAEKLDLAERAHIHAVPVGDFVPARQADVVIDATGTAEGFELACRTVRPRGTIALKSTFAGRQPLNLSSLVVDEVTLIGSRCGPFADAIGALARGEVDVSHLISRRVPLDRAVEAFALAAQPDVLKVLLHVG